MANLTVSAGLVHVILWISLCLTIISTIVNVSKAVGWWQRPIAPLLLVRGLLSACYALVYSSRLTEPVLRISDPTSLFSVSLGIPAWVLVWIMPAMIVKRPPIPSEAIKDDQ